MTAPANKAKHIHHFMLELKPESCPEKLKKQLSVFILFPSDKNNLH
jgi:hypothetical protein